MKRLIIKRKERPPITVTNYINGQKVESLNNYVLKNPVAYEIIRNIIALRKHKEENDKHSQQLIIIGTTIGENDQ